MRKLVTMLAVLIMAGCGRQDDFYTVTKIIEIQDTITIDKPFEFKLILRNDSLGEMKLTIDDTIHKSVFFGLDFRCNDQFIRSDVENPKSESHNYQEYYLRSGDSLAFRLRGLFRQSKDGLQMEIDGYDRIYKIEKVACDNLKINFGGMWIPGDFNPLDPMEGYNFAKEISVIPALSDPGKLKN